MFITERDIPIISTVGNNRKNSIHSNVLMLMSSIILFVLLVFVSKQSSADPIGKLVRGEGSDGGYLFATSTEGLYQKVPKLFGANVPSLMMIEDPSPMKPDGAQFRSPTEFEVKDIIETLQRMGVNLVRTYPPSIAQGGFSDYMHSNDYGHLTGFDENKQGAEAITFDRANLSSLKRTLHLLEQSGIQVVIPMIDYWCYWGGIQNFVDLVDHTPKTESNRCYINHKPNLDKAKVKQFLTNEKYISAYKSYVLALISELGQFKNIIWETGNELGAEARYNTNVVWRKAEEADFTAEQKALSINLDSWTKNIAAFIKKHDPNHLLMDGRFGVSKQSILDDNIDILSNHYYQFWGMDRLYEYDLNKISAVVNEEINKGREAYKKPYFAGEFLCDGACTYDFMDRFQQESDEGVTAFAAFWSLRGHADQGRNADTAFKDTGRTGLYTHFEENGYSAYHYPGSDVNNNPKESTTQREIMQRFSEAAVQFSGMKRDDSLAKVQRIDLVETSAGTKLIWSGVAGAEGYCVYKDGQLVQNVKFIAPDGKQFSGLDVTDKTGYSVTAYKPLSGGCHGTPDVPEKNIFIYWDKASIGSLSIDGQVGSGVFSQTAQLFDGTVPLATQVQYRCFTLDVQGNAHDQSCNVIGHGQFSLEQLNEKVKVVVEAFSDEHQLVQKIEANLPSVQPTPTPEPILGSAFHCPKGISQGNSLLDSENNPKFDGGNTWPYYLANSDNIANADVPFGTVKAEIDSSSPSYHKALCRYPEGTRQAAGRIQGCQAMNMGFSEQDGCQMRP
ncbi:cellulase family glycosylhydrolase [uncultured Shewanella sp.]|uniref:cellulase family glycosylhydrolase n=1 Tax=uncultured Shewanella sp. TaxID=173975 RepID=UPI00260CF262|nr:cellulase family glycosylhydrolase [uncultured Shewanella sp.]